MMTSWHQWNDCGSNFTGSLRFSLKPMSMKKLTNIALKYVKLVISQNNKVRQILALLSVEVNTL